MSKNVTFVTILLDSFTAPWQGNEVSGFWWDRLNPELAGIAWRLLHQDDDQEEQQDGHGQNNELICHGRMQEVDEFSWHRAGTGEVI